jgi:hypothetical protein
MVLLFSKIDKHISVSWLIGVSLLIVKAYPVVSETEEVVPKRLKPTSVSTGIHQQHRFYLKMTFQQ